MSPLSISGIKKTVRDFYLGKKSIILLLPVHTTGLNMDAIIEVSPTPLPSSKMYSSFDNDCPWCSSQSASKRDPRHIWRPTRFRLVL